MNEKFWVISKDNLSLVNNLIYYFILPPVDNIRYRKHIRNAFESFFHVDVPRCRNIIFAMYVNF